MPSERHRLRPATVAVAKLALMAKRLVEETVVPVIDEPNNVVPDAAPYVNVLMFPVLELKAVELSVLIVPLEAVSVTTFSVVPVAFV